MAEPQDGESANSDFADASDALSQDDGKLPGTAEQSADFLANLRSSYTPRPTGLGMYGAGARRNAMSNFLAPGPRLGLAAPFSFDESSATTIDGAKIETENSQDTDKEQRHTERLKTGDTLRQLPDQEILEFKNKDRLIIYKSLGWIMEDGKGNAITRQVTPSLEKPGDNSTFGLDRGGEIIAQAIEFSGITTIIFNNGDKIIFDLSGVSAISRKKDSVYLRDPIRKTAAFSSPFRRRTF